MTSPPPRTNVEPDTFTLGDLLDRERLGESLRTFAPDIVIHLAAKTSLKQVTPGSDHYAANTVGTANLIDAIESCPTVRRGIYASTKYVCRGRLPNDDIDFAPHTCYGESKVEMEKLIRSRAGGGIDWCIVRPTTVWGPGMGKHYQNFLHLIEQGRYFHISNGNALKHLSYVGNIVHQLLCLSEAAGSSIQERVFYLSDYEPIALQQWAGALQEALKAPAIFSMPYPIALCLAKVGDLLVKMGLKKFPFTSFRFKNLTEDDLCPVEITKSVCGKLPFTLTSASQQTVLWFQQQPVHTTDR